MTDAYRPARGGTFFDVDFDQTPFTLAWEITRACGLACLHCRAEAIPYRDPAELSTEEAFGFIDQVVDIGKPILVVTGGDPLMRPDVYDLIEYAVGRDLRVALSPSATGKLTRHALERAASAGTHMLHLSLDGSTAEIHDRFRGVLGSYERTIARMRDAADLDLLLQIGTTVSRHNLADLHHIGERVAEIGATVWTVFFLVPTGRGQARDMLSPQEHEAVFEWLHAYSQRAPFHIRTIAAQHYRRVVIQAERQARGDGLDATSPPQWGYTGAGFSARVHKHASAVRGVNDGNGFCFVSHVGDVYPSGFLQVKAGNIREQSLSNVYRYSPIFRALRDPAQLKGTCGACEFRAVCGGSRARAYALTGDFLASDPTCVYRPSPAAVAV
ncbi:MAG TPA: TIGR04053 family radical SAM/SPASM domain-containing protein [Chloroflexota bacterium]